MFNALYFRSICGSSQVKQKDIVDCKDELLQKGIETNVIFAIENSKKVQRLYPEVNQQKATTFLNSADVEELSKRESSSKRS